MKKIIISIFFLLLLIHNSNAAELKDCSVYSKLSPKFIACKTANLAKNTLNYQNKQWSNVIKKNKKD